MNPRFDLLLFRQVSSRLYGQLFAPLLSRWILTQAEMEILLFLANNPEYDTAASIVAQRGFAKSQVSSAVDTLERRGFLIRQTTANNRRVQHLQLLPAAELVVSEGQACRREFMEQLFADMSPTQRELLGDLLSQLTRNAQQALLRQEDEKKAAAAASPAPAPVPERQ